MTNGLPRNYDKDRTRSPMEDDDEDDVEQHVMSEEEWDNAFKKTFDKIFGKGESK